MEKHAQNGQHLWDYLEFGLEKQVRGQVSDDLWYDLLYRIEDQVWTVVSYRYIIVRDIDEKACAEQ